jgi:predicted MFS family arabinose efflux permease
VAWGVVVGLGTGLTAMVMGAIVSTRWFIDRRGLVLGILGASTSTGQLAFLPLAAAIEQHWGWRWALAPTLVALALSALAVVALMADRPADLDLPAYGAKTVEPAPATRPAFGAAVRVLGEVAPHSTFWVLAGTFFVCGLSTNGLIQTHFIAFCGDYGIAAVTAASVLAMMGVLDLFGTIGSGWLSDRVDNRALLFMYYGLRGLSLIYLPGSSFSFDSLTLFAAFYGLDWIATVPPTVRLTASAFGPQRSGVAFGWIFASHQVGAAVAAFGGGLARTLLGAYAPAFYVAGVACLAAAMAIWLIGPKRAAEPAPAVA